MQYKCIGFNILVNKTFEWYMAQQEYFMGKWRGILCPPNHMDYTDTHHEVTCAPGWVLVQAEQSKSYLPQEKDL